MATSDDRLRVALVNDYEVIVAGVRSMLFPFRDRIHVVELDVRRNPSASVDVALFDTYGQAGTGLGRLRSLVRAETVGAVAVYTWTLSTASRTAAIEAGAQGLIAKALPAAQLADALEALADGELVETGPFRGARTSSRGPWPGSQWGLTARESEVLACLAAGMSNRATCAALFVSDNTVRTHVKAIFRKLGVNSRSQAVIRALGDPSFVREESKEADA